jgi:glutaredoxin
MSEIKIKANGETDYAQVVKDLVSENKTIMFSKGYCPYCKKLKNYLNGQKIDYKYIEIDDYDDKFQTQLAKYSKMSTVPQFFVDGKLIGILQK